MPRRSRGCCLPGGAPAGAHIWGHVATSPAVTLLAAAGDRAAAAGCRATSAARWTPASSSYLSPTSPAANLIITTPPANNRIASASARAAAAACRAAAWPCILPFAASPAGIRLATASSYSPAATSRPTPAPFRAPAGSWYLTTSAFTSRATSPTGPQLAAAYANAAQSASPHPGRRAASAGTHVDVESAAHAHTREPASAQPDSYSATSSALVKESAASARRCHLATAWTRAHKAASSSEWHATNDGFQSPIWVRFLIASTGSRHDQPAASSYASHFVHAASPHAGHCAIPDTGVHGAAQ